MDGGGRDQSASATQHKWIVKVALPTKYISNLNFKLVFGHFSSKKTSCTNQSTTKIIRKGGHCYQNPVHIILFNHCSTSFYREKFTCLCMTPIIKWSIFSQLCIVQAGRGLLSPIPSNRREAAR